MAKGSQLSQLKSALSQAGFVKQQQNGKKRKRTPKSKRDGYAAQKATEAAALNGEEATSSEAQLAGESKEESAVAQDDGPVLTRLEKKQKRNLARRMKGES